MSEKIDAQHHLLMHLLTAVLHFMRQSGMPREQMDAAIAAGLKQFDKRGAAKPWLVASAPRTGDETVESAVLRLWHRDHRYIDDEANPVPVRLYGRAPSVESLVRMQRSAVDAKSVIAGLRSVGLIKRAGAGKYLPASETATISFLHPLSIEHVAKSVMRLLGTVLRNTDKSRARLPLIERSARVPDLDPADSQAFAKFTREQGIAYLQAVDDWLETHRIGSSTKGKVGSSIGAGVHLYAYMGNDSDDLASLDLVERAAGSFRRSSSAARSGNKRAAAPYKTSGVPA